MCEKCDDDFINSETEDISHDDLEAASDFFDDLISGKLYPPENTNVGPFTIKYMK